MTIRKFAVLLLAFQGLLFATAQATATESGAKKSSIEQVVLFTIDYCPKCLGAKKYFSDHAIPYTEFNIEHSDKARDAFEKLGGQGTPFLLVGGKRMQGFSPDYFEHFYQQMMGNH